ncbi:site-specific integrase [Azoarcus sp. KH32C]|uniref:tyrosine-type recombinase/integrase n=1 Tax=Azoarcus sp. KH32C TaxID=748247 RepID=UPI0002386FDD|nr:site-specific integrase [Azoarcus sp. KH32C]BAL23954.1 phage integrase family protein [Azoarcus sp. KH32C]
MATLRKHGRGWQARVRRRGYPDEVKTFPSKAEAERWARAIEGEMDRGEFVSRVEAEKTTFGEVIQRYMKTITPKKRGCTEETIRLTATLRHRMTKLSMANLTPQAMAEYRDDRLRSCKANTVIRDLAVLSSIINHARREWGIAIQNPVEMIRKPTMPPGRDRVLAQSEETRLLAELTPTGRRNPLMPSLVIVAIETAMRRGEILAMRWENVDLDRRVVFLPLTKNGQARYVPLSTRAVEALTNLPRSPDGRVFSINVAAMEANFMKAVRRAGLLDMHFHDLRHTAASRMATKLPNVIELASVTGHTSIQMLKRYYHPKAEELALKLE